MRKIAVAACIVAIPLSLWCYDLANHSIFPSPLLCRLLGPQERAEITSAPDYAVWDMATMLLMLGVCAGSAVYLGVRIAIRMRGAGRRASLPES